MDVASVALKTPIRSLFTIYIARTALLLLLAVAATYLFPDFSPLGYDTSSTHIIKPEAGSLVTNGSTRLVTALTRWDAVYFVRIMQRGYLWEQEWAFGIGQSYLLQGWKSLLRLVTTSEMENPTEILLFSVCSCVSHFASAVALYYLTIVLFETVLEQRAACSQESAKLFAFVAAILHVLSPAGIFLIAPYNESIFSALSFLGYLAYSYAIKTTAPDGQRGFDKDAMILLSGFLFGISCLFRSNGIMNGVLLLFEVSQSLWRLSSGQNVLANVRSLLVSGMSGALVGLPTLWRQYVGWQEYCGLEVQREWCGARLPSIYSFVQRHYWGVGFMKYWTPGNIPLFLLAAPMLFVLVKTSLDVINILESPAGRLYSLDLSRTNRDLLFRLAVPQLLLAILAVTNYHVQIITRLSSGLPLWYIIVAAALIQASDGKGVPEKTPASTGSNESGNVTADVSKAVWSKPAFRFMLGYQIVQAVLYGGFLPPA